MKKAFTLVLAALMLLSCLAGCGSSEPAPMEPTAAPAPETTVPQETSLPEETEAVVETTVPEEPDTTPGIYTLGEKMDDYTFNLSDGTTVSLYELLETKEMVLLNFWATWCSPCRYEFPFMQQAYLQNQDKVGIIALSTDDDNDAINSFKRLNSLTSLPMAHDENLLTGKFRFSGIPTSVVIDRFGVVCWQETGSITDAEKFQRLFDAFTGDDYTESKVGYRIPGPKPTVEAASDEELNTALNVKDGTLSFTNDADPYAWPFLPSGGKLTSSNTGVAETFASVLTTVEAKAGDVLAFDYAVKAENYCGIALTVNGQEVAGFFQKDSGTFGYRFDADGSYEIKFTYENDGSSGGSKDSGTLDNVRLLTGDEAAAMTSENPAYPRGETRSELMEPLNAKAVVLYVVEDDSQQLRNTLYVAQDNPSSGSFRMLPGREHNPYFGLYYTSPTPTKLVKADYDSEGFKVDVKFSSGRAALGFIPDVRKAEYREITLFKNEDAINAFMKQNYGDSVSWAYEEDMPVGGTASGDAASGLSQYKLSFVDQNGAAVAGVNAQICTDQVCNVMTSDARGIISFEGAPYAYEVHVLTVPEGYEKPEDIFILSVSGGEVIIPIQKQ